MVKQPLKKKKKQRSTSRIPSVTAKNYLENHRIFQITGEVTSLKLVTTDLFKSDESKVNKISNTNVTHF